MKPQTMFVPWLAAALLATGCDRQKTTDQQIATIKAETQTDAQDMKNFTYAQKDQFVSTMQKQLAALNQDLDKLSAQIETSSDAVKAGARPKLQALRDESDQLNKQLDGVKNSTESTWESVKASSQKAWDSLKNDVQSARQWTADKIAP